MDSISQSENNPKLIASANEDDTMFSLELEWAWRDSQVKLTDKELIDIFPEAAKVIPEKIKEWKKVERQLLQNIKNQLLEVRATVPEQDQWFAKAMVKYGTGAELVKARRHIMRLYRLKNLYSPPKIMSPKKITAEKISRANQVPIVDLVGQYTKLRKSGTTFIALCPLHKEKSPSFVVYPLTNSWHCFGCGEGSSSIDLIMKLNGLSFKDAVQFLIRS
jgi:hypothetical protein